MTKINLKTKDKVKVGRKNKSAALCACNEEGYGCFALLRNDGILPLKLTKNLAILECKKSKMTFFSLTTCEVRISCFACSDRAVK